MFGRDLKAKALLLAGLAMAVGTAVAPTRAEAAWGGLHAGAGFHGGWAGGVHAGFGFRGYRTGWGGWHGGYGFGRTGFGWGYGVRGFYPGYRVGFGYGGNPYGYGYAPYVAGLAGAYPPAYVQPTYVAVAAAVPVYHHHYHHVAHATCR